jgi:hypothetical protein
MQVEEPAPVDIDSAEPGNSVQGAAPELSATTEVESAAAMDESSGAESVATAVPGTDSARSAKPLPASDLVAEQSVVVDNFSEHTPAPNEGADQSAVNVNEASTEAKPLVSDATSGQAPPSDTSSSELNPVSSETTTTSTDEPALPEDLLAVLELQAEVLKSQVHALQTGQRAHAALVKSAASEKDSSSSSSLSADSGNGSSSSSSSSKSSSASDPLAFAPLVNPTRDESTLCKLLDEQGGLGSRAGVGDFVDLCQRTTSTVRRATLIAVRVAGDKGRETRVGLPVHFFISSYTSFFDDTLLYLFLPGVGRSPFFS